MDFRLDDYIDGDVAYFMGLVIARGSVSEQAGTRQLTIEFPYSALQAQGITKTFDQEKEIKLGLNEIRERLTDLLETSIRLVPKSSSTDLVIRFLYKNMMWRNIMLLTGGKTHYSHFSIPKVLFDPQLPKDWKREFLRGYADVSGNVRKANR